MGSKRAAEFLRQRSVGGNSSMGAKMPTKHWRKDSPYLPGFRMPLRGFVGPHKRSAPRRNRGRVFRRHTRHIPRTDGHSRPSANPATLIRRGLIVRTPGHDPDQPRRQNEEKSDFHGSP